MRFLPAAAVLTCFFWMLGGAPLFDVDEGAFSQATMEMFSRGDFLSTYLNGQPRYDKPILVYWLQAASVAVLGPVEFAFRLPSALCSALWAWITFFFVKKHYGEEQATLAALLLAASLGVFVIGRAATADALLNLLIAATMFSAWMHLSTGKRGWLYCTHAAIAFGLLAKGPIAVLVPFAVTFLFCILRKDLKTWLRAVFDWRALTLLVVIAAPWYAVILYKEGWGFVEGFFLRHNVGRFGGPMQGHGGSLVYYFPALVVLTLPFTALLVPLALRLRAIWRDDLQYFLLLWFLFVFVFFSLSGTKLPHYLLYGITGLVVLMAVNAQAVKSAFWALLVPLLCFVLLLFFPQIVEQAAVRVSDAYLREALAGGGELFTPLYQGFIAACIALVLYSMVERSVSPARKLVLCGVLVTVGASTFVVPALGALIQEPVREAARVARTLDDPPILWRFNAPSFSVHYGQPTATREPRAGDLVVTKAKWLASLPAGLRYQVFYSRRGVVVVRVFN